ncbi:MAG: STAS domain-containing protein [Trichlorobacter sp.]|jgi:anti-sigma B factor antagonist|nr:STAS domain-containing protein [Trichlorobacter sp.]
MNIKLDEHNNGCVLVKPETERIDANNAEALKIELSRLFEESKKCVVVDLQQVRFIDSSGLGALVSGFKNASSRQASLKLCSLQSQVKSMFELTRLHRVFDIFDDAESAFANK